MTHKVMVIERSGFSFIAEYGFALDGQEIPNVITATDSSQNTGSNLVMGVS